MNTDNIEKLKRLIHFRERQRDMAAAKMETARRLEDEASQRRQEAAEELDSELETMRQTVGHSMRPDELDLAVRSAKWAQINLFEKEKLLQRQEQNTEKEREKLLESHKKVKQMETLHLARKKERHRQDAITQQTELDDLAAVKEVRK